MSEFFRPEDFAWDPTNPAVGYFTTTASITDRSRVYKITFSDITNPEAGGTIEMVIDGTEGHRMFDNLTVTDEGKLILLEDVGNNARLGRVYQYDPATDKLTQIAEFDNSRFGTPPTAPFNQDEESSGVIDVTNLLGYTGGKAYLLDAQAHYGIAAPIVEGGQLLAMYVDEVKNGGAGNDRVAGDAGDNFALNGFAGNDTMLGGSGNDGLLGGRGTDVLDGGRGNDVLQGGLDADTFVFFSSVNGNLQASNGDIDYVTDFSFAQGDSFNFNGATVTGARVSFLSATGTLNGIDLDNSARGLDLEVTLTKNGVTQKVVFLDAYGFGSNAQWENALGVDLNYPRPLPTGGAFADIFAIP